MYSKYNCIIYFSLVLIHVISLLLLCNKEYCVSMIIILNSIVYTILLYCFAQGISTLRDTSYTSSFHDYSHRKLLEKCAGTLHI